MAKYITKDDYFKARGIDLEVEFTNVATDNPSGIVEIVLQEVEDFVLEFMDRYFEAPNVELDPKVMKKVMIYQVDYFRRNGLLISDANFYGCPLDDNAYGLLHANGYANTPTAGLRGRWFN